MDYEVTIVGAGPAGMTAAYYLAKGGVKTAVFERGLRVGGGMPGGGMMFNRIVVQDEGKRYLTSSVCKRGNTKKAALSPTLWRLFQPFAQER